MRNLELEGNERVLEIGIGSGAGIAYAMSRLPWGFVSGVDPSGRTVRRASRKLKRYVRSGLVHLERGDASDLPWQNERFDAVVSTEPFLVAAGLREVRRVLKDDGQLSLVMPGGSGDEKIEEALWLGGFTGVVLRTRRGTLYITARAH